MHPDTTVTDYPLTPRQRTLLTAGVVLTTFYFQCFYLLMASTSQTGGRWTTEETMDLINYLYDKRSEMGDASSFRNTTFTGAAQEVRGRRWSAEQCKTRFGTVSLSLSSC